MWHPIEALPKHQELILTVVVSVPPLASAQERLLAIAFKPSPKFNAFQIGDAGGDSGSESWTLSLDTQVRTDLINKFKEKSSAQYSDQYPVTLSEAVDGAWLWSIEETKRSRAGDE